MVEPEPDSNHLESVPGEGIHQVTRKTDNLESRTAGGASASALASGSAAVAAASEVASAATATVTATEDEHAIGEADTTAGNANESVSVFQAVADEGLDALTSRSSLAPTSNGSGGGSPDDGAGRSAPSPAAVVDAAATAITRYRRRSSRNSIEVGDLVSGSGMEDEAEFRTSGSSSSVNGEPAAVDPPSVAADAAAGSARAAGPLSAEVTTSDESMRDSESEAVGRDVDNDAEAANDRSAQCRKRTASQTEMSSTTTTTTTNTTSSTLNNSSVEQPDVSGSADAGAGSSSSSSASTSSAPKRFRSDANGIDDEDARP